MSLQMNNDPEHIIRLVTKRLQDNSPCSWVDITKTWSQSSRSFMSKDEKETSKPDPVKPVLSGETDQNTTNYCEKLLEGNPKWLTQVRQFKGNDTRNWGDGWKLLILRNVKEKKANRNNWDNPNWHKTNKKKLQTNKMIIWFNVRQWQTFL